MQIKNADLDLVVCVKRSSGEVIGGLISPTYYKEQFAGQLHPLCRAVMIPMNPAVFQYTFIPQQKKKTNEDTNFYSMFQKGLFGAL